jgi:hypothetical protein
MKLILVSMYCLFIIAACSASFGENSLAQQPKGHGASVTDYASLIDSLRAAGVNVEPQGEVDQPFFSVKGRMIKVHSEDVQVFEYSTASAADAEAALVSPDGRGVGRTKLHWVGPPHFYKKEKVLVLYIGDNDQVLKALEAVLGPQFAGR